MAIAQTNLAILGSLGNHLVALSHQQFHLAQIHLGCDGLEDQPLLTLVPKMHFVGLSNGLHWAKPLQYTEIIFELPSI
jgi:hypothetical protein